MACVKVPSTTESKTTSKGEEVAMRIRKAFLSATLVMALVMLAGTVVMAANPVTDPLPPPPISCTTSDGLYQITASTPAFVAGGGPNCWYSGGCTEIQYTVTGGGVPDHVAALAGVGIQYVLGPGGVQWYDRGVGDPVTGLGDLSFHEQAAKFNPTGSSLTMTIGLAGTRQPSPTSVATKKGKSIGACRILGIGLDNADNPLATVTPETHETLGGKCKVKVTKVNGVISVTFDGNSLSEAGCTDIKGPFSPGDVDLQVTTSDGTETGPVEFSEGFNFIVGSGSCTYKQYYPPTGAIYKICY
jgi:hypothetical protein